MKFIEGNLIERKGNIECCCWKENHDNYYYFTEWLEPSEHIHNPYGWWHPRFIASFTKFEEIVIFLCLKFVTGEHVINLNNSFTLWIHVSMFGSFVSCSILCFWSYISNIQIHPNDIPFDCILFPNVCLCLLCLVWRQRKIEIAFRLEVRSSNRRISNIWMRIVKF